MIVDPAMFVVFLVASFLYASVGHGGASAYIAVFALLGFARVEIIPVVLAMNIVVAGIGFLNYRQAGHFSPRLLLPLVLSSIPASFLGGLVTIGQGFYAALIGGTLFFAAIRFVRMPTVPYSLPHEQKQPETVLLLIVGALLGFLSGLVGVGGGIFLSPLILLMSWADAKKTGAISAAFIILNSASGLSAHLLKGSSFDWNLFLPLLLAVSLGGFAGSFIGARHLSLKRLQQVLAGVLAIAGTKMLLQLF